jgi:hypothetical protein
MGQAILSVMLSAGVSSVALAQSEPQPKTTGEAPSMTTEELTTTTGTVQKVDAAKKRLTVRGPDGNDFTVKAGDTAARDLDRVKVGDKVDLAYYQSMAVTILKPGESPPKMTAKERAMHARAGQLPGGMMAQQIKMTATVEKVDDAKKMVSLKLPDGTTQKVKVEDPALQAKFASLKPGDDIDITYTEAVAASLKPTAKGMGGTAPQGTTPQP